MLRNVSIILIILIVQVLAWGENMDDLEPDARVLKYQREQRLQQRLKEKGQLPFEEWYEDREYNVYWEQVNDYWPKLKESMSYFNYYAKNVTHLSYPKYEYYISDPYNGYYIGNGTTWILLVGSTMDERCKYVVHQMQMLIERLDDYGKMHKYKFQYVEGRYDENLELALHPRIIPHTIVIDPHDGLMYYWDRLEYPTNQTMQTWIEEKEYLNSTYVMPRPYLLEDGDIKVVYVMNWLKQNIGARFHRYVMKVPGLPNIFQMFVDHDGKDPMRFKQDRVTLIVAPLLLIFVIIPSLWTVIKILWRLFIACCSKEQEIEVDPDDPKLQVQREQEKELLSKKKNQ